MEVEAGSRGAFPVADILKNRKMPSGGAEKEARLSGDRAFALPAKNPGDWVMRSRGTAPQAFYELDITDDEVGSASAGELVRSLSSDWYIFVSASISCE